jgi:hypothetical protein
MCLVHFVHLDGGSVSKKPRFDQFNLRPYLMGCEEVLSEISSQIERRPEFSSFQTDQDKHS